MKVKRHCWSWVWESIMTLGSVLNLIFPKQHGPVSHYAKQRRAWRKGEGCGAVRWPGSHDAALLYSRCKFWQQACASTDTDAHEYTHLAIHSNTCEQPKHAHGTCHMWTLAYSDITKEARKTHKKKRIWEQLGLKNSASAWQLQDTEEHSGGKTNSFSLILMLLPLLFRRTQRTSYCTSIICKDL